MALETWFELSKDSGLNVEGQNGIGFMDMRNQVSQRTRTPARRQFDIR
jgi:hypothetical protein